MTYDTLQDNVGLGITCIINDAGAVDEKDATHQRDVLPHLQVHKLVLSLSA